MICWAMENKSVKIFCLNLLTKKGWSDFLIQEKTKIWKRRKLGYPFVCAQHFWSKDFLRWEKAEITQAAGTVQMIFILLQFPLEEPWGVTSPLSTRNIKALMPLF